MKQLLLSITLALLLAAPALATTSATTACDSDTSTVTAGGYVSAGCYNLCNMVIATDTACTEFDFEDHGGLPDQIVLKREENNAACTDPGGPVFTITTGPTTGGSPAYEVRSSPIVLNDTVGRITIVDQ